MFQDAVPEPSVPMASAEDEVAREYWRERLAELRKKVDEHAEKLKDDDEENNPLPQELGSMRKQAEEISQYANEVLEKEDKAKLDDLEKKIDELESSDKSASEEGGNVAQDKDWVKNAEVVTLPSESEKKEEGILGKIKEFLFSPQGAIIGGLIKQYISLRRTLAEFFPSDNPDKQRKQLAGLEALHERFFGVFNLRNQIVDYFDSKGMSVEVMEERDKDENIRSNLKRKHGEKLKEKTNGLSVERQAEVSREYTFEVFILETLDQNLLPFTTNKDKHYVITLYGIENRKRPVEQEKEESVAKNDGKDDGKKVAKKSNPLAFLDFG